MDVTKQGVEFQDCITKYIVLNFNIVAGSITELVCVSKYTLSN